MKSDFTALAARVTVLENGGSGGSTGSIGGNPRAPSGGVSTAGSVDGSTVQNSNRVPVNKRQTLCIGGYQYTEGLEIAEDMQAVLRDSHITGWKKVYPVGSYADRVKIEFDTSQKMWDCLVAMKGKKVSSTLAHPNRAPDPRHADRRQLWHTIDKYPEELTCQSRATHAKDIVKKAIQAEYPNSSDQELTMMIDASKDMGSVILLRRYLPPEVQPRNPLKLLMRNFPFYNLKIVPEGEQWLTANGIQLDLS